MDSQLETERRVHDFAKTQPWNHNFVLPNGVETRKGDFSSPAKNSNKLSRLEQAFTALEISGKKVLDVGCNEGFFSIELAKRGAIVTGLDADANRIEKAKFIKEILAEELPITYECNNFLEENISIEPASVVLCLGFLHRVPDPITVVKKLSEIADTIVFEWKAEYASSITSPSAIFSSQDVNESDPFGTEYWLLSVDALKRLLKRHGIEYTYLLPKGNGKREILVASRSPIIGLTIQDERYRLFANSYRLLKECLKTSLAALSPFK